VPITPLTTVAGISSVRVNANVACASVASRAPATAK